MSNANNETSLVIYQKGFDAEQKLDYFLCGGAGALFAYVGQHYEPHLLNNWYFFLMPLALLFLTISLGISLKRLHLHVSIALLNQDMIRAGEEHNNINKWLRKNRESKTPVLTSQNDWTDENNTIPELELKKINLRKKTLEHETEIKAKCNTSNRIGFWRNFFLIAGFLMILFTKVFQPYLNY